MFLPAHSFIRDDAELSASRLFAALCLGVGGRRPSGDIITGSRSAELILRSHCCTELLSRPPGALLSTHRLLCERGARWMDGWMDGVGLHYPAEVREEIFSISKDFHLKKTIFRVSLMRS